MPLKPEALDYEGVFPGRAGRGRENAAPIDVWPNAGKLKTFDDDRAIPTNPAPAPAVQDRDSSLVTRSGNWIRRRGHTLSFIGLFLFSIVLYLRPYELIPALSSFRQMAFYTGLVTLIAYAATQVALEGNLTARPREINLVLLIGVAALLSMPLAEDPGGAWKTFNEMLLKTILIFVVLVNVVRTEMRLKLLLLLVLGVSIYLSINAINDYRAGIFATGAPETHDLRIGGRIKGLFENSNDLALHLVSMIPIAVTLGLSGRNPLKKLIYFGVTGLMVAAVIVTFSRGGFIGLVAATFVLVRRLGRKNRVATTGALVFAVILFLALAPGAYSSRLSTIFNSAADLTASSSQRTEVLKRSFWVALRYPVFGVGIGNFRHKSPRNLETHNAYTQVAAEMGLAAMVIYILFLIHPIRRMRLIENESYEQKDRRRFYYLSVGLQASLIGFMFSSFFGAVAYQWYVYYLVAYAVCLHRLYIMKFPPEDEFARERWEHPFSKKTQKLMAARRLRSRAAFRAADVLVRCEMDLIGGIHDSLSLHVLTPFSRLQRSTRPATRPTQQAFYEGIRFRRQAAGWDTEKKTRWILDRLRTMVRRAYEETVYYRELFDRNNFDPHADFGFEEFSRLPVLTREDVHEAGRKLLSSSVPEAQLRKEATGGSTGVPTEIWLGPNERGWRDSGMEYFFETLGVPEGSRTALLWGHHLDPQATDSLRDRYQAFVSNTRWFDSMRLSSELLDKYHEDLQRFRPAFIVAYASALGYLAEHVLARKYKPNYPTRCFVTGGEKLWSRHRRLIEKAFGRPVHERYGSRDAGCLGVQLAPGSLAYTIDWSYTFVEPELPQPESPILVTKLQADAMPMIRYSIGDTGRFPAGSKPGHPTFVLPDVMGRVVDRISLPDGRWIAGQEVPHLLKDYPVREFLFLQRQDHSVELQIVPQKEFNEDSLRKIEETLRANLPGLSIKIEFKESVVRTKSNKWRPVISEARV